jgi:hypothetical protein
LKERLNMERSENTHYIDVEKFRTLHPDELIESDQYLLDADDDLFWDQFEDRRWGGDIEIPD